MPIPLYLQKTAALFRIISTLKDARETIWRLEAAIEESAEVVTPEFEEQVNEGRGRGHRCAPSSFVLLGTRRPFRFNTKCVVLPSPFRGGYLTALTPLPCSIQQLRSSPLSAAFATITP